MSIGFLWISFAYAIYDEKGIWKKFLIILLAIISIINVGQFFRWEYKWNEKNNAIVEVVEYTDTECTDMKIYMLN